MKITGEMLKYGTQRLIQMDREEIVNDKNANKAYFRDFVLKSIHRQQTSDVRSILPYLRRNAWV
jgi:hypothetical protein